MAIEVGSSIVEAAERFAVSAKTLNMALSTVSQILSPIGMGKLGRTQSGAGKRVRQTKRSTT